MHGSHGDIPFLTILRLLTLEHHMRNPGRKIMWRTLKGVIKQTPWQETNIFPLSSATPVRRVDSYRVTGIEQNVEGLVM